MSFKMAGVAGVQRGDGQGRPGRARADLPHRGDGARPTCRATSWATCNSRRGRVQGTDTVDGGLQQIIALVPTAEIQRYAVDLRSLTGGRGRFRVEPRPLRRDAPEPRRAHGEGQGPSADA